MEKILTPGEHVHNYRLAQKPRMTLEKLAFKLKTTAANLSRIENGQEISKDMLPRFMKLGFTAAQLRPDLAILFVDKPPAKRRKAA